MAKQHRAPRRRHPRRGFRRTVVLIAKHVATEVLRDAVSALVHILITRYLG